MSNHLDQLARLSPAKRALVEMRLKKDRPPVTSASPIRHAPREGLLLQSFAQQRLWLHDQIEPNTPNNIVRALHLKGSLDVGALQQAIDALVARHESLRTTLAQVDDKPIQVIQPAGPVPIQQADLRGLPRGEREAEVERWMARESKHLFKLSRDLMLRVALLRLADDEHVLNIVLHHVAGDGWSLGIIARELGALYQGFATGKPHGLPELPIQYADYAQWQQEWLQGAALEDHLAYWKNHLGGDLPPIELPLDRPRPRLHTTRGARHTVEVPAAVASAIKALCQREGVTLYMLLLAAYELLLHRYSRQDHFGIGSFIAGRTRVEVEGLIGFFVNTVVIRADCTGNPTFRELLRRVREHSIGAYAHQDLPLEKVLEAIRPRRDLSRTPLFQVAFVLQNASEQSSDIPGLQCELMAPKECFALHELTLSVFPDIRGRMLLNFIYNTDLFDASTIARMAAHLVSLLEAIPTGFDQSMLAMPMLTPAQRNQILTEWSGVTNTRKAGASFLPLFEDQAARHPDRIAIEQEDRRWTYAQLNVRANQLAHYLRKRGVGPDTLIGICADRSMDLIVGLLGVLKSGGAYVPMDPTYPAQRLSFMLRDSGVKVLLTRSHLRDRLPSHDAETVCLDSEWDAIGLENETHPAVAIDATHAAYVIYTSGSTGKPKGVLVSHGALSNYVEAAVSGYGMTQGDRVLQFSSISFDASVEEIFPTLALGATLVLRTESMIDSIPGFFQRCRDWNLTFLSLPTAFWHEAVTRLETGAEAFPESIRTVIIGGERVTPDRVAGWHRWVGGRVRLWNTYGPTETTVVATVYDASRPGDLRQRQREIPIGRPIANTFAYILDTNLEPVPPGIPGELHLGGAGLARGYLHRDELTRERFVPNPFSTESGARLYKTGDLVRWLPDGNIEFLGRVDQQVKLRGFRIELGEIESALRQHDGVRECVVIDREDIPGQKRLVTYVVPKHECQPSGREWRSFLKERIPDYMIPSAFVTLDRLPLTPNGKLDRHALPTPAADRPDLENRYAAPRNDTERAMAQAWSEVLGVAQVGIHDSFFDLGGHSLLATQVISRLRDSLRVELPLRVLFEKPTIAALAEAIERGTPLAPEVAAPPMKPAAAHTSVPATFQQQRLWFLDQLQPGSTAYNMPFALRLCGTLNPAALEQAITEVQRRHETLRTTLSSENDEPLQIIHPSSGFRLMSVDLGHLPEEKREQEAERLVREEVNRPFDLGRGPLFRALLLRLRQTEHVLALTMHHIISDGWSIGVLVREIEQLYAAFREGKPSPLPDLAIQYGDFAHWQRDWLRGEALEAQLAWWKRQLGGKLPVLQLPTDRPRRADLPPRGARVFRQLDRRLSGALRDFSRREGATLFMTTLAAFQTLLYRQTGQEDILIGTPIAGRNRAETELMIGFFVNTLVLRTDLSGTPTFRELLGRVREAAMGAFAHQEMPFEKLVEELQPDRDLTHTPLFQVFFNMINLPDAELHFAGLDAAPIKLGAVHTKFDLTLYVCDVAEELALDLVYNAEWFDEARMTDLIDQFELLLAQIVARPDQPLDRFSLVTARAKSVLPDPSRPLDPSWPGSVADRFTEQARRVPRQTAVTDGQVRWTYAELDARSNQLARGLLARGVHAGDVIAVYCPRSAHLVPALLGIVKAGAAFVVLDPSYPPARLVHYLREAKPRGCLTLDRPESLPDTLREFLATQAGCFHLGLADEGAWGGQTPEAVATRVGPDDLAYVAFTSGSTGVPRAILGTHCPLSHFLQWHTHTFDLGESDRFSMLSGLGHDPLLRDIFAPLWVGATICVPAFDLRENADGLSEWMQNEKITIAHLTPGMLSLIVPGTVSLPALRCAFFGGDTLKRRDVVRLRLAAPRVACVNFYGATETPQAMGHYVVPADESGSAREVMPIGRGIEGVQLLVMNRSRHPAGIGELGEICIRTPYLARGYANDEALTRERFLANPVTNVAGDRLYRTGDQGRYLTDGAVECVGRADDQVKIRGHRVELGEVRSALEQHPSVGSAAVVAQDDATGERCLVAFCVARNAAALSTEELRGFLKERLPDHAIPAGFSVLAAIPLTPNGKLDRGALPRLNLSQLARSQEFVAPRTMVEEIIASVWCGLLRLESVGVNDNFFERGGHSLLAIRLVSQLRSSLGVELPVRALFESPTVAGLAKRVGELRSTSSPSGDVVDNASLLVPIQQGGTKQPFFLVPGGGGGEWEFLVYARFARYLGMDYPFFGLRARGTGEGEQPHASVEAMAADYLREIRRVQPQGPYRLVGECIGGIIAYEMAQQLVAQGERVSMLALLDTPRPTLYRFARRQMSRSWFEHMLAFRVRILNRILYHLRQLPRLNPRQRAGYIVRKIRTSLLALAYVFHLKEVPAESEEERRLTITRKIYPRCAHLYRARPFAGRITLIVNENTRQKEESLGWAEMAGGGLDVIEVPGNHYSYIRAHVQVTAEKLRHCLDKAAAETETTGGDSVPPRGNGTTGS